MQTRISHSRAAALRERGVAGFYQGHGMKQIENCYEDLIYYFMYGYIHIALRRTLHSNIEVGCTRMYSSAMQHGARDISVSDAFTYGYSCTHLQTRMHAHILSCTNPAHTLTHQSAPVGAPFACLIRLGLKNCPTGTRALPFHRGNRYSVFNDDVTCIPHRA